MADLEQIVPSGSVDSSPQRSNVGMMSVFSDSRSFDNAMRMAQCLSSSTIVPKEYQGNEGNCLIALEMAARIKTSPMMVMQNLFIVNGRPGWSSQWIIAMINASHRYRTELQFEFGSEEKDGGLSCRAWAEDFSGHKVYGPKITMEMARQEGWLVKNNSKWRTMPEVMIQYRAASFFGRMNCPDMIMGIYSADEALEMEETPPERVAVSIDTADALTGGDTLKGLPGGDDDPIITQEQRQALISMAQSSLGKASGNDTLIELIKKEGYESSYEIRRSAYDRIVKKLFDIALKKKKGAGQKSAGQGTMKQDGAPVQGGSAASGNAEGHGDTLGGNQGNGAVIGRQAPAADAK